MPNEKTESESRLLTQEYEILHEVARVLHSSQGVKSMLKNVLSVLTGFDELKVERKAGIFLADPEKKISIFIAPWVSSLQSLWKKKKWFPMGTVFVVGWPNRVSC